jgi:hypothetical protein
MPIILAIEPDRRQRDALAAVVRQRVGAELVLADTTERALEAIGNRVPDLVLVPALLSPQDDAALAAALRVIAAAAHVRTLTIPVLAAHSEAERPSGLLSRWRRGRSASEAPDGCDPAVFAEQITAYLKESAAERALRADDIDDAPRRSESEYTREFGQEVVQAGANLHVTADGQSYTPIYTQADEQPDAHAYVKPEVAYTQPDVQAYAQPDVQPYMQADVQNEVVELVEGDEDAAGTDSGGLSAQQQNQEEDIDLSDELSELEPEEPDWTRRATTDTELFDGDPIGVYTLPSVVDEPVDVPVVATRKAFAKKEEAIRPAPAAEATSFEAEAAMDPEFFAESFRPVFETKRTEPVFEEEAAVARAFEAETADGAPAVEDIYSAEAEPQPTDAEPWGSAFMVPQGPWPATEGVRTEPVVAAAPTPVDVPAVEARPAAAPHKHGRPEWGELVASLRKDIERRRTDPPQETPTPTPTPAADSPAAPTRAKKSKPIQDEWGFFDPEQCGFAALLAKLDEITEDEDVEVHQSK